MWSEIGIGFHKKILLKLFSSLEKCVLNNIGNLKPFSNDYTQIEAVPCRSEIGYVLFQKRVRGFHQVSKHEKTFETTRPAASWFYCFRVFGNLMKPEARVFVITSPTKKIRSTYHFNEFSRFKYSICGS